MIQELSDLDPLAPLRNLSNLCLLQNPVSAKPQYRQYIIHKLPQLRLLDFRKIKQKEREATAQFFKSREGKELLREIAKKAKIQAQSGMDDRNMLTEEERSKIRDAISNATSLEEVQRLSKLLQAGHIPGQNSHTNGNLFIKYLTSCLTHILPKRCKNDIYSFNFIDLCFTGSKIEDFALKIFAFLL